MALRFILIKVSIVRSTTVTSQLTIQRSVPLFLRVSFTKIQLFD